MEDDDWGCDETSDDSENRADIMKKIDHIHDKYDFSKITKQKKQVRFSIIIQSYIVPRSSKSCWYSSRELMDMRIVST